jgi:aconitate hydratase
LGVTALAPGTELTLRVKSKDGKTVDIPVKHTMNENQIEWFKHGSALNFMRKQLAGKL